MTDILTYLIETKCLAQIIKIFPVSNLESKYDSVSDLQHNSFGTGNISTNDGMSATNILNETHQIEKCLFTQFFIIAIDRDRAERLGEMIKTTGHQLYETYNRNKQFFN